MKPLLPLALAAAAVFSFTACDKEKVEDVKTKTVEAAKSVGEATKDTTGKVLEKSGEFLQKAGDKIKGAGEKLKGTTEKIKESPALEKFKTGLDGFSNLMTNMKGQAGTDLNKAKAMINDLSAKLNTVSTEGIPEDVKKAYQDYRDVMTRALKFTMNIPADQAAREKYFQDHAEEGHKLEKDSTAACNALREAAAKHGLTNLELGDGEE